MGCYNKTCGLTNLPIMYKDKAVVYLLLREDRDSHGSSCYASGWWSVIPIPFYGIYNDYGNIDLDKDQEWKLEILHKYAAKGLKDTGSNPKYDKPITADTLLSWEDLSTAIHRRNIALGGYSGKAELNFIMFARESYDAIKGKYSKEIKELEQFISYAKEKIEAKKLEIKNDPESFTSLFILQDSIALDYFENKKIPWYDNPSYGFLQYWFASGMGSSYGYAAQYIKRDYSRDILGFRTDIIPKYNVKEMADAYFIQEIFLALRKTWMPQSGDGSQDGLNDYHAKFYKIYGDRMKSIKSKYGE